MVRRTLAALVTLAAFLGGLLPTRALQPADPVALLNSSSCSPRMVAQAVPTPVPTPSQTPGPAVTPLPNNPSQLFATPFPSGSNPSPPPVPTPTPAPSATKGPIFIVAPSGAPSIAPVLGGTSSTPAPPAAGPTPLPTLAPGYVGVVADKVKGNVNDGRPADLYGHVAIFYSDEELVGDRAHWDGHQYLTITGNPYIINREQNSILYGDVVTFDAIAEKADLTNGRGESTQGVEKGLVYFSATDLRSDSSGVAHGTRASITTCERPRAGYHITGRDLDVKPGDRITIYKAVLWLGAVAVFYLPKVVIPLRSVEDERRRPQFFPELGYDQYQGFWVKARVPFGTDSYYYGYYRVEFFSKVGLGLGYVGAYANRNGRRNGTVNYYGIHDKRTQSRTYNVQAQDYENFSNTLHGNFGFNYNSNFGPLTSLPANTGMTATVTHQGALENQTYQFSRYAIGGQSSTNNFGFNDSHTLSRTVTNALALTYSTSNSNYGGFFSENQSAHANDLLHWQTAGAQYQLTFDKSFSKTPYGIDKLPELQILPNSFFPHFLFPLTAQFTAGEYSEPQYAFHTSRGALTFNLGPALLHIFNSDFSAQETINQFLYGTGDLKAAIQQSITLVTPIGRHIINSVNYSAQQYNGPAAVPFYTLDIQSSQNFKTAQDTLRFFNNDVYNLALGFATNFNGQAQPVTYSLMSRPSPRSYLQLGGYFSPGSGNGFGPTNVQFITPFGRGGQLQFIGDIDWKNKGRIENKTIYYSRIIGDCYEIFVTYNQALRQVNMTLNILAFPSRSATFGIGQNGPIYPSSLNP